MTTTTTKGAAKPTARDRLLAAADELFYREGIRTVGIDRVIEQAGVAKASLYNAFGSKDALVRAYLEGRHAASAARFTRHIERYTDPRDRLLAVFDAQAELLSQPDFRGCAFACASAEAQPGDQVDQAAAVYRGWLRERIAELAAEAGVPDPETLARQLQVIYDGGVLAARMDREPGIAEACRAAGAALVDAALRTGARDERDA